MSISKKACGFRLLTHEGIFSFVADSEKSAKRWCKAINKHSKTEDLGDETSPLNKLSRALVASGNMMCVDCDNWKVSYVNSLLGVLLCESCGRVHQKAFGRESVFAAKHLDEKLNAQEQELLCAFTNDAFNVLWEAKLPTVRCRKPRPSASISSRAVYIAHKYHHLTMLQIPWLEVQVKQLSSESDRVQLDALIQMNSGFVTAHPVTDAAREFPLFSFVLTSITHCEHLLLNAASKHARLYIQTSSSMWQIVGELADMEMLSQCLKTAQAVYDPSVPLPERIRGSIGGGSPVSRRPRALSRPLRPVHTRKGSGLGRRNTNVNTIEQDVPPVNKNLPRSGSPMPRYPGLKKSNSSGSRPLSGSFRKGKMPKSLKRRGTSSERLGEGTSPVRRSRSGGASTSVSPQSGSTDMRLLKKLTEARQRLAELDIAEVHHRSALEQLETDLSHKKEFKRELVDDMGKLQVVVDDFTLASESTSPPGSSPRVAPRGECKIASGIGSRSSSDSPSTPSQLVFDEGGEVRGGTVGQLVMRLTALDPMYMSQFLMTFRSFTTTRVLLALLRKIFERSERAEQLRIVNLLKHWIKNFFMDFDSDAVLMKMLLDFLQDDFRLDLSSMGTQLRQVIKAAMDETEVEYNPVLDSSVPSPILPKVLDYTLLLTDIDPLELARQMCIRDQAMLRKISPQELTAGNWNSRGKEEKSPNVVAFISRFNALGRHVTFLVVREDRLKNRIRVVELLIQLASHLHEMANFNALLSVLAGLTASAVSRMKKTWKGISKTALQTYEELRVFVSSDSNYKHCREAVENIAPPCVPYLGIYLKDLVFIQDGTPDRLGPSVVNFAKRRRIAEVITALSLFRHTPYPFRPVPVIQHLIDKSDGLSEVQAFNLSLLSEPKDVENRV